MEIRIKSDSVPPTGLAWHPSAALHLQPSHLTPPPSQVPGAQLTPPLSRAKQHTTTYTRAQNHKKTPHGIPASAARGAPAMPPVVPPVVGRLRGSGANPDALRFWEGRWLVRALRTLAHS